MTTPAPPNPSGVISGTLVRVKAKRIQYVTHENAPIAGPLPAARRPAKVAQMLALAHHIQNAIDRGLVKDRADVARRLNLTRTRITQLLDLTLLAPDIQDAIMRLEAVDGVEPLFERWLREVVACVDWREQREVWSGLLVGAAR
jgi:hypothetical protein